ncbi:hypothetical protein OAL31_00660 [Candidatus Pelagibacter sp.]|nr:hypothetical protein [Candidatus Pelagibacter sp.]
MLSKFKHNFKIFKKLDLFKNSLLKKKLNKFNVLLEIKFNKLNFLFKKKKSTTFTSYNKTSLFVFGMILVIFSYLSIPYFYNVKQLTNKIEAELSKKLNINFNLSHDFSYSFFPRPHYTFKEVTFLDKSQNSGTIKIDIPINKLLFIKDIQIKDIILSNVNFEINNENYDFFTELLKNDFSNFKFEIKKSNIFYRNSKNDVLFINQINYLKYYYDKKILSNILTANNEIFNLLYNIKFYNDFVNKKNKSIINFNSLNLKIENDLNYKNSKKEGLTNFSYNKNRSKVSYNYTKDLFEFHLSDKSIESKFNYKGTINFKPFFSESTGLFKEINSKKILDPNSILLQFLKTGILNNKNLNMNTTLNVKRIDEFEDFINLLLKINISEGLIDIDDTTISWLNDVDFKISDSLIYMNENNLILDALITIQINNYNKVYKFFQTPRNYRKEVKKVELDLSYNFDQLTANLNDIRIDGSTNQKINVILKQLILRDNKLQNRIFFKNLLNQAIKLYAG